MSILRVLIRALSVLLFVAFGTVAAFAAPGDWARVTYPVEAQEFCVLPVILTNAARAPPHTSANVMATGIVFAQADDLRASDGAETTGVVYALLRSSIATNKSVDNILAGGKRLPSKGGPTTQIQKAGGLIRQTLILTR